MWALLENGGLINAQTNGGQTALHLAATGLRSGMPDNTMVRATTPAGEHIKLENWPLADDAGATVRVAVAQTQLQHCVQGASGLEDGAALELRLEPNRRGPSHGPFKGLAFAVHDAATGDQCGYVQNADMDRVRAPSTSIVAGTAIRGDGGWLIEAPAPAPRHVVVPADWTYEGKVSEVKSKNDSLWAEQRMWIRALTEHDYDIGYKNPYLFEDDGEGGLIGTVDIYITKVAEKGGRKKGVAGGHVGMEVDPVVAED